jgi:hypothetical protein
MSAGRKIMSLDNYNFDGFIINLYVDEQGDWLAHFQEIPTISAFGDTRVSSSNLVENVLDKKDGALNPFLW